MNRLAGAAVFVVTLVVALLVTNYYHRRPEPPPPTHATAVADPPLIPESSPSTPSRSKVNYKVRLVTLDVAARWSHTTLTLEQPPDADPPAKLWVWVGFFVPGEAGGEVFAGEPVMVSNPFASGDGATLSVTADCRWCGRRDAPAAGYYAHVNVSTVSAADARLEDGQVGRDITKATPVTVEQGRRGTR